MSVSLNVRLFLLIATITILLLPQRSDAQKIQRKVMVIGHRGAAAIAPENTMLAIQKAILLGVDRVEIDIHQTKDGKLVVIHDPTLDRTTNGKGKIKKYTFRELREFQIDSSTERLSLLEDAMDWCNNKAILLIDIKTFHGHYKGLEENLVEIIRKNEFKKKCIIQSFDSQILKRIHKLDPDIKLCKLAYYRPITCFKKRKYISEFSFNKNHIKKRYIDRVHSLGKKVNVYTVNNPDDVTRLVAMGVDGIITDDPKPILDRLK